MSDEMSPFDTILASASSATVATVEGPNTEVADATNGTGTSDGPEYPSVLGTFEDEASAIREYGELYNAKQFADNLTLRNVRENKMGAEGIVPAANVYAAMKAKRHPLPVVIVDGVALLPQSSIAVWDERPTRGDGDSSDGGKLSDEGLLIAYGRSLVNAEKRAELLKSAKDRNDKAVALVEKRVAQLTTRNLFTDDVDQRARAAYAEDLSRKDAAKEISDDNEENDS